jgi:hypothetical protein
MNEPAPPPSPSLLRLALVFYGALFGAAVVWAWRAKDRDYSLLFASPEAAARGVDPLCDTAAGILLALAVVLLSGWFTRATRVGDRLARALAQLVGRRTTAECLVLALASGIGEEAFFRGAMQPEFGLVPTSLCFALAHFIPRRELLAWTPFSLAAGFALGWLFKATGNLVGPVVAHALVNAVNLRRLSRDYAQD